MDSDTNENSHLYGFNNPCFYSSLFFISNITISYYYDEYIYSGLFSTLLVTSLLVHYNQNEYIVLLDKMMVFFIIVYGFYVFTKKCTCIRSEKEIMCSLLIVITFVTCVYLYLTDISNTPVYFCGFFGNFLHAFIHLVGSVGHNLIVLL